MCKAHVRQCPHCNWYRVYAWTYCPTWDAIEYDCVLRGERCGIHPSECTTKKEKNRGIADDIWFFPYPALQCGNGLCPSLKLAEQVQAEAIRVAEAKKKAKEELQRKKMERDARFKAAFANRYFRKIRVLSVKEQEEAWEEELDRRDREVALVRRKGI